MNKRNWSETLRCLESEELSSCRGQGKMATHLSEVIFPKKDSQI